MEDGLAQRFAIRTIRRCVVFKDGKISLDLLVLLYQDKRTEVLIEVIVLF